MRNKSFNINSRIVFLYFSLVLVAVAIVLKILYVQEADTIVSDYNEPKFFEVEAPRGNIFADDGSLLAISMPLYDIHLDMTVMDNQMFNQKIEKLSIGIAEIFPDMNTLSIQTELESAKKANKQYYLLKNKVTHNELKLLKKLPIFNLGRNKGGLISEIRPNREKPFGILAKRTIGILREANPVGIERAFNQVLSGVNGIQLKQKVGRNRWMPKDSEANKLPIAGNDVVTTINTDMQDVAEDALHKALIRHNASWGCVVLMEVETGHVKVIANLKKNEDSFRLC